jgi:hypothetical protein
MSAITFHRKLLRNKKLQTLIDVFLKPSVVGDLPQIRG